MLAWPQLIDLDIYRNITIGEGEVFLCAPVYFLQHPNPQPLTIPANPLQEDPCRTNGKRSHLDSWKTFLGIVISLFPHPRTPCCLDPL